MVGSHTVYDLLTLSKTLQKISSNQGVGAFDFMVDGLTNVMQQTCFLGFGNIYTHLGSHQLHDMRHFDGVFQDILAEAATEFQTS